MNFSMRDTTYIRRGCVMKESDRLRAYAESCLVAARSMSLSVDAERLKAMAGEALARAEQLEMPMVSHPSQGPIHGVTQQQQQIQPKKKDDE
jgi:hypothetical protein